MSTVVTASTTATNQSIAVDSDDEAGLAKSSSLIKMAMAMPISLSSNKKIFKLNEVEDETKDDYEYDKSNKEEIENEDNIQKNAKNYDQETSLLNVSKLDREYNLNEINTQNKECTQINNQLNFINGDSSDERSHLECLSQMSQSPSASSSSKCHSPTELPLPLDETSKSISATASTFKIFNKNISTYVNYTALTGSNGLANSSGNMVDMKMVISSAAIPNDQFLSSTFKPSTHALVTDVQTPQTSAKLNDLLAATKLSISSNFVENAQQTQQSSSTASTMSMPNTPTTPLPMLLTYSSSSCHLQTKCGLKRQSNGIKADLCKLNQNEQFDIDQPIAKPRASQVQLSFGSEHGQNLTQDEKSEPGQQAIDNSNRGTLSSVDFINTPIRSLISFSEMPHSLTNNNQKILSSLNSSMPSSTSTTASNSCSSSNCSSTSSSRTGSNEASSQANSNSYYQYFNNHFDNDHSNTQLLINSTSASKETLTSTPPSTPLLSQQDLSIAYFPTQETKKEAMPQLFDLNSNSNYDKSQINQSNQHQHQHHHHHHHNHHHHHHHHHRHHHHHHQHNQHHNEHDEQSQHDSSKSNQNFGNNNDQKNINANDSSSLSQYNKQYQFNIENELIKYTKTLKLSTHSYLENYKLGAHIRNGGFSEIYEGFHFKTNENVIIKLIPKKKTKNWLMVHNKKYPAEVLLHKMCNNVNGVVKMLEFYEQESDWVIIMPKLLNCMDLFDYLESKYRGRLSESEACHFFTQLVKINIDLLSQGVVHRDLKSENLLVDMDSLKLVLIDFGASAISRSNGSSHQVYTDFHGTRQYKPPEYITSKKYSAVSSTTWTLGILLYDMCNGQLPFETEEEILEYNLKINPSLSDDYKCLLLDCLQQDPKMRPSLHKILEYPWIKKNANLILNSGVNSNNTEYSNQSDAIMNETSFCKLSVLPQPSIQPLTAPSLASKQSQMLASLANTNSSKKLNFNNKVSCGNELMASPATAAAQSQAISNSLINNNLFKNLL
jgi:serine/threonine protein kinase